MPIGRRAISRDGSGQRGAFRVSLSLPVVFHLGFVHLEYPVEVSRVALLQVLQLSVAIDLYLELVLEELQPRPIFFEDLHPDFRENRQVVLQVNQTGVVQHTMLGVWCCAARR